MDNFRITNAPVAKTNIVVVEYIVAEGVTVSKIELTKDNTNFIEAKVFNNSQASFDISEWGNGAFTDCFLRVEYDLEVEDLIISDIQDITLSTNVDIKFNFTSNKELVDFKLILDSTTYDIKTYITSDGNNHSVFIPKGTYGVKNYNATLSLTDMDGVVVDKSFKLNVITPVYGVITCTNAISITEGTTYNLSITLDKAPTEPQIVTISTNSGEISLNKTSLEFLPSNYNTVQVVTITAPHDNTSYYDKTAIITLSTTNTIKQVTANIINTDILTSDMVVNVTSMTIDEGETGSFSVRLGSTINRTQVVNITVENPSVVSLSTNTLTFETINYSTAQNVTVTAGESSTPGNMSTNIVIASGGYSKTIAVVVKDTTVYFGEIKLTTTSLSVEEDLTTTFGVSLDSTINQNQIVQLTTNNSNITLNKSQLTFTSSNWNKVQYITITAKHDANSYDDKSTIITLTSSGVTTKTVNVTITNIDMENPPTILDFRASSVDVPNKSATFEWGITNPRGTTLTQNLIVDGTSIRVTGTSSGSTPGQSQQLERVPFRGYYNGSASYIVYSELWMTTELFEIGAAVTVRAILNTDSNTAFIRRINYFDETRQLVLTETVSGGKDYTINIPSGSGYTYMAIAAYDTLAFDATITTVMTIDSSGGSGDGSGYYSHTVTNLSNTLHTVKLRVSDGYATVDSNTLNVDLSMRGDVLTFSRGEYYIGGTSPDGTNYAVSSNRVNLEDLLNTRGSVTFELANNNQQFGKIFFFASNTASTILWLDLWQLVTISGNKFTITTASSDFRYYLSMYPYVAVSVQNLNTNAIINPSNVSVTLRYN